MLNAERYRLLGVDLSNPAWPVDPVAYPIRFQALAGRCWWMTFDRFDDGVPITDYGGTIGVQVNPSFVAYYGLYELEIFRRTGDPRADAGFWRQVRWVCENRRQCERLGVYWVTEFDWPSGLSTCKAPFPDAMTQGLAISLLVRAWRLSGEERYLDLAAEAVRIFTVDAGDGGIRSAEDGEVFYEEYPAAPYPRVLDGFLVALIGLADLAATGRSREAGGLLSDGLTTLTNHLHEYDFLGRWSFFGGEHYRVLSTGVYHAYNVALLEALGRSSRNPSLLGVAARWGRPVSGPTFVVVLLAGLVYGKLFYWRLRRQVAARAGFDRHWDLCE